MSRAYGGQNTRSNRLHCHEYLYKCMALTDMIDAASAALAVAMLAGEPELPETTAVFGTGEQRSHSVAAAQQGFVARHARSGEQVTREQVVAEIFSPASFSVVQRVAAPFDGFIMSLGQPPQT